MKKRKLYIILYSLFTLAIFYAAFFHYHPLPGKERALPSAEESAGVPAPYDYYVITDESGAVELMRVRVRVYPGDEVLAADNKLYQVTRLEANHAYAAYIRQVKL